MYNVLLGKTSQKKAVKLRFGLNFCKVQQTNEQVNINQFFLFRFGKKSKVLFFTHFEVMADGLL